jgi:CheY-like chemotaxis protein
MLVDDEKSYVDLLSQMLVENLDCPVQSYTRPLDALADLCAVQPAVIVTDYDMPQINGIEFMRRATRICPDAVFVLITGRNLGMNDLDASDVPALKAFIAKPFRWRHLADELIRVWPGSDQPAFRQPEPSPIEL